MPAVLRKQVTKDIILDPVARLKQLTEYGSSVEIDKAVPVKRYFRSGAEMERQARVYYQEGRLDNAFILYNKFATLFVEKLPKHPEYAKALPADRMKIKKLLKVAFPRAMELKEKLKLQYEKEKEELERKEREANEKKEQETKRLQRQKQLQDEDTQKPTDKSQEQQVEDVAAFLAGEGGVATGIVAMDTSPPLNPSSSSADVSSSSVSDTASQPPGQQIGQDSQTNFQEQVEPFPPVSSATPGEQEQQQWPQTSQDQPESLRLTATNPELAQVLPPGAVATGTAAASRSAESANFSSSTSMVAPSAPPPAYDQVAAGQGAYDGTNVPIGGYDPAYQQAQAPPPAAAGSYFPPPAAYTSPPPSQGGGPYDYQYAGGAPAPVVGGVPSYGQQFSAPGPSGSAPSHSFASTSNWGSFDTGSGSSGLLNQQPQEPSVPYVDRSTKPTSLTGLSTGWGGNEGYRPVYFPADTASRFEEVASPNTRKNIETCGILAGKLSQNTLRVTHIIVPKQKGNSDSCETINEEELFDVQDQYDLITLGWIHTHPSQTAFMSSVDLHCHCSYQIMLDEAIAIVCAPKYNQVGVYMLTEPHGLNYITSCEQEGFHTHPKEPPLYEECKHVHSDNTYYIQIVDLR